MNVPRYIIVQTFEPQEKDDLETFFDVGLGGCRTFALYNIQIRLMGGGAMTHTFRPSDTLVDVNQHILLNQDGPNQPFLLMTNFPKKIFSPADMRKTLKELGNYYSRVPVMSL